MHRFLLVIVAFFSDGNESYKKEFWKYIYLVSFKCVQKE
jgi:hypothetical protein